MSTATEAQNLRPEVFHEVDQPSDGGFLFLVCDSECLARNMYMQAASTGLMAEVSERAGFFQHLRPRHVRHMILQRHRVGHKFHTVVERTVRLGVKMLMFLVCDRHDLLGVLGRLPGVVNLQFHTEMPQTTAVKDRLGLVIVPV